MGVIQSLNVKWKLFWLGHGIAAKFYLLKPYIKFYLEKLGINHLQWTEKPLHLKIKLAARKFTVACRDSLALISVFREIFGESQYEPPYDIGHIQTIADVGANIGLFALFAKGRFPNASLVCVEPDPENLGILRENIAINRLGCVILHAALMPKGGPLEVRLDTNAASTSRSVSLTPEQPKDDGCVVVPAINLDYLLTQFSGKHVDLLKCDIEGAEGDLFAGITKTTATRIRHIVVECHSLDLSRRVQTALNPFYECEGDLPISECQSLLWFRCRGQS